MLGFGEGDKEDTPGLSLRARSEFLDDRSCCFREGLPSVVPMIRRCLWVRLLFRAIDDKPSFSFSGERGLDRKLPCLKLSNRPPYSPLLRVGELKLGFSCLDSSIRRPFSLLLVTPPSRAGGSNRDLPFWDFRRPLLIAEFVERSRDEIFAGKQTYHRCPVQRPTENTRDETFSSIRSTCQLLPHEFSDFSFSPEQSRQWHYIAP